MPGLSQILSKMLTNYNISLKKRLHVVVSFFLLLVGYGNYCNEILQKRNQKLKKKIKMP